MLKKRYLIIAILLIAIPSFSLYSNYKFNECIKSAEEYLKEDNFIQAMYQYEDAMDIKKDSETAEVYSQVQKINEVHSIHATMLNNKRGTFDEDDLKESLKLCKDLSSNENTNSLIKKSANKLKDELEELVVYNTAYNKGYKKGYTDTMYSNPYDSSIYYMNYEITYENGYYKGYDDGYSQKKLEKKQEEERKKEASNPNPNKNYYSDDDDDYYYNDDDSSYKYEPHYNYKYTDENGNEIGTNKAY